MSLPHSLDYGSQQRWVGAWRRLVRRLLCGLGVVAVLLLAAYAFDLRFYWVYYRAAWFAGAAGRADADYLAQHPKLTLVRLQQLLVAQPQFGIYVLNARGATDGDTVMLANLCAERRLPGAFERAADVLSLWEGMVERPVSFEAAGYDILCRKAFQGLLAASRGDLRAYRYVVGRFLRTQGNVEYCEGRLDLEAASPDELDRLVHQEMERACEREQFARELLERKRASSPR